LDQKHLSSETTPHTISDQKQLALKGLIAFDLAVSPAKSKIPCLCVLCGSAVKSSFHVKTP
jgi:hypothetical protein